jgi:aspartate racemase
MLRAIALQRRQAQNCSSWIEAWGTFPYPRFPVITLNCRIQKGIEMKTIGLLGGMSWESTVPYYRTINEAVREKLGGLHSARIILYSVDFHDVERLQHAGNWKEAGILLASAATALQHAGADFLVLCTNTMHKVAEAIHGAVSLPLLHIADPTGEQIARSSLKTVGLLGTRFTMEQDFYSKRLRDRFGLAVVVPGHGDREIVHRVIYEELCLGRVLESSRDQYRRIIHRLVDDGAEAIVLGCTEIAMLVGQLDSPVPIFDTTAIHARAAAEHALAP